MSAPSRAPLEFPASAETVTVRAIDSTARVHVPMAAFIKDPMPGHEMLNCPAFSFLVEHPSGARVLFDLGVRKDQKFPPVVAEGIKGRVTMEVEKDVSEILTDAGLDLGDINSIIWSHWHMDHNGDPSLFPSTTELVVGPGFKKAFVPGYPENPMGVVFSSDFEGRELREIEFNDSSLRIGDFRAFDFFGDGSFYLLDGPGHTIGHICALARTTPTTFVLLGGDACHHCGALRPTEQLPLPSEISPSPFSQPPHLAGTVCPGALIESIHPQKSTTEPFYPKLSEAAGRDVGEAEDTIRKLKGLDADDNVFIIIAHDTSLLDLIDLFPKPINDWKQKGWKEAGRWRFLQDFKGAAASQL